MVQTLCVKADSAYMFIHFWRRSTYCSLQKRQDIKTKLEILYQPHDRSHSASGSSASVVYTIEEQGCKTVSQTGCWLRPKRQLSHDRAQIMCPMPMESKRSLCTPPSFFPSLLSSLCTKLQMLSTPTVRMLAQIPQPINKSPVPGLLRSGRHTYFRS